METYADGHVNQHELLEELVHKILAGNYREGGFHPGEVRDEKIPVQPGLTNCEAVIDVVTYIDGTPDTINNDGLQRIVDKRKATVASKRMASDIIKSALADPNDADPSSTAAKKIREQAAVWRARSHTTIDLDPVVLESIADELRTVSSRNINKRDALKQIADREDVAISMLAIQCP